MPAVIDFIGPDFVEYEWGGLNVNTLKELEVKVMVCPYCSSKEIDCGLEFFWYCTDCRSEFDQDNYMLLFTRWRYVR